MGKWDEVLVGLALTALLTGCWRINFDEYVVEGITVENLDGEVVPPGGSVTLEVRALPGPFVPGTEIELKLYRGFLSKNDTTAEKLVFDLPEDGHIGEITATIPLNAPPGSTFELTATAPLSGDLGFEVRDPGFEVQNIDARSYTVHEGFVVDEPLGLEASLQGRVEQLEFPPRDSPFGEGLYLGLSGPPELWRDAGGTLEQFAVASAQPDEHMRALSFAKPEPDGSQPTGYGDVAYMCTTRTDGIIAIDAQGSFVTPVASFACHGLTFDHAKRLDYDVTWATPLYFTSANGEIGRIDPEGQVEILGTGLPTPDDGLRLEVCPKDFLSANTIVYSPGAAGVGTDGQVIHIDRLVPFDQPFVWLDGLAEPEDVAFVRDAPWGWLMFVAVAGEDKVVAVNHDGDVADVVSGIGHPVALAVKNGELWIAGQTFGEVLRVRPAAR